MESIEKNLVDNDIDQTLLIVNHKRKQDDEELHQSLSKVFRSESTPLSFGIANVLQSNSVSSKMIPTSIHPWLLNVHQCSPPSSFTALANASNWCARCSMHFRLTTDLVHHIRVHHATRRHHSLNSESSARKSSTSSAPLQCHICSETFRQRHHLTRHMTSHR